MVYSIWSTALGQGKLSCTIHIVIEQYLRKGSKITQTVLVSWLSTNQRPTTLSAIISHQALTKPAPAFSSLFCLKADILLPCGLLFLGPLPRTFFPLLCATYSLKSWLHVTFGDHTTFQSPFIISYFSTTHPHLPCPQSTFLSAYDFYVYCMYGLRSMSSH